MYTVHTSRSLISERSEREGIITDGEGVLKLVAEGRPVLELPESPVILEMGGGPPGLNLFEKAVPDEPLP